MVWGIRIQSTFALVQIVRAGYQGIETVLYHRLIACMGFLHEVRLMSSDSWALGSPGSGNKRFQWRLSSFFN